MNPTNPLSGSNFVYPEGYIILEKTSNNENTRSFDSIRVSLNKDF